MFVPRLQFKIWQTRVSVPPRSGVYPEMWECDVQKEKQEFFAQRLQKREQFAPAQDRPASYAAGTP
jgi:hypothetical protein